MLVTMGIVVIVGVTAAVAVLLLRRHRPAAQAAPPEDALFGADALDLDAVFSSVEAEEVESRRKLIATRLDLLRRHRVPLRRLSGAPGKAVARLGFADGTVLLARSRSPGDMATVVRLQRQGSVVVGQYAEHPDGLSLDLTSAGGTCTVIAVGLDQAD